MNKIVGKVFYDEKVFEVDLADSKIQSNNFWKYFTKNSYLSFLRKFQFDLMIISEFVYYCDRLFLRESAVDGWKRDIHWKFRYLMMKYSLIIRNCYKIY